MTREPAGHCRLALAGTPGSIEAVISWASGRAVEVDGAAGAVAQPATNAAIASELALHLTLTAAPTEQAADQEQPCRASGQCRGDRLRS